MFLLRWIRHSRAHQLTMHLVSAVVITAAASCSLVLDDKTAQCVVDIDCDRFDGYPSCQAGVCVATGLGPPGCFRGAPTTQEHFANQCTTAHAEQFDNCARL